MPSVKVLSGPAKLIPPASISEPPFAIRLGDRQRRRLESAGEFPRRVPTSARSYAYIESELVDYVNRKVAERDGR